MTKIRRPLPSETYGKPKLTKPIRHAGSHEVGGSDPIDGALSLTSLTINPGPLIVGDGTPVAGLLVHFVNATTSASGRIETDLTTGVASWTVRAETNRQLDLTVCGTAFVTSGIFEAETAYVKASSLAVGGLVLAAGAATGQGIRFVTGAESFANTRMRIDPGGDVIVSGPSLTLQGNTPPEFNMIDLDAAADSRQWDQRIGGGGTTLEFRAVNDASTLANIWLQVDRSGFAIGAIRFPSAAPVIIGIDIGGTRDLRVTTGRIGGFDLAGVDTTYVGAVDPRWLTGVAGSYRWFIDGLDKMQLIGGDPTSLRLNNLAATVQGGIRAYNSTPFIRLGSFTAHDVAIIRGDVVQAVFDGTGLIVSPDPGGTQKLRVGGGAAFIAGGLNLRIDDSGGNSGIEFGRIDGTASTPFIDFHSGVTAVDYDARIIASGGSGVAGGGSLTIAAIALDLSFASGSTGAYRMTGARTWEHQVIATSGEWRLRDVTNGTDAITIVGGGKITLNRAVDVIGNLEVTGGIIVQGAGRVITFDDDNVVLQRASVTKLTLASTVATLAEGLAISSIDATVSALAITGPTYTTDVKLIDATVTWNSASVVFTGILFNATITAELAANSSKLLLLQVGGVSKFEVRSHGSIIGSLGDNITGLNLNGGSLTGANAQAIVDLSRTWNTTGAPAGIKLNITNTASGAGARLADLQVGGASKAAWDINGKFLIQGTQVVETRKTGYTAITGTADRGTAYATSTITLQQLAERVKAIQDDLTTHGLIGA